MTLRLLPEVLGKTSHLLAVALTPVLRVQHQQRAEEPSFHDIAPATLRKPISAMRADSASRSFTASNPDAVIR